MGDIIIPPDNDIQHKPHLHQVLLEWTKTHKCAELFCQVYFTLIMQKVHRTYSVLKGADVGDLLSYMVEETGVTRGNQ